MSYTIKEWFNKIHDPVIRDKALGYWEKNGKKYALNTYNTLHSAISIAFPWLATEEGSHYWMHLANKPEIIDNLL